MSQPLKKIKLTTPLKIHLKVKIFFLKKKNPPFESLGEKVSCKKLFFVFVFFLCKTVFKKLFEKRFKKLHSFLQNLFEKKNKFENFIIFLKNLVGNFLGKKNPLRI